jgi:hypothetical protein
MLAVVVVGICPRWATVDERDSRCGVQRVFAQYRIAGVDSAQCRSRVQLRVVSWVDARAHDARCSKFLDWLGGPQVTSGALAAGAY